MLINLVFLSKVNEEKSLTKAYSRQYILLQHQTTTRYPITGYTQSAPYDASRQNTKHHKGLNTFYRLVNPASLL
jgi:hypothetical protein